MRRPVTEPLEELSDKWLRSVWQGRRMISSMLENDVVAPGLPPPCLELSESSASNPNVVDLVEVCDTDDAPESTEPAKKRLRKRAKTPSATSDASTSVGSSSVVSL